MKKLFANGIEPADNTPLTQQEVIDDLIDKKGAYGTRVQEANELYQQKKNDAEVNDQTLSAIEQSAEKTKQVIDHTKYASLLDPYDLSENPTDGELLAKWDNLSPADKKEFNRANGYTGMYPYGFQRDVMDSYASSIKQQRVDAEKAAAQAAADEANAPIKVENGTDTPYEVTKDFSDWYKQWEVAYTSTNNAATRSNLVQQLSDKMSEARLPSKDVVPAGKDAQGNPVDPFVSYMEQFLGDGKGDFTQFNSFQKVLEAAKQDRTPKQPEQKSWEDRWFEHQAKQYALERDQEQRRLKGQMLGRGIGDLAATIGDMVRASEGAPVTQRDWQKYYDQLTAQEQANVNNYRIRMQKLAEDQMKLHQQQKAAAAAAAEKAAERQYDWQKLNANLTFKGKEGALERQLKWDIANLNAKAAKERANIYAQGRQAQYEAKLRKDTSSIPFNGKMYYFPRGTWNDVAKDLSGMLEQKYKIELKLLQGLQGFKNEKELEIYLRNFLQKPEIVNNPDKEAIKEDIENMLAERSLRTQIDVMNDFDATYTYTYQSGSAGASQSTSGNAGGGKLPEVEAVNLD